MADRGIWSSAELGRRLESHGLELSASQVHRLVTSRPDRLSLRNLEALCEVLECTPNDLLQQLPSSRNRIGSPDNLAPA